MYHKQVLSDCGANPLAVAKPSLAHMCTMSKQGESEVLLHACGMATWNRCKSRWPTVYTELFDDVA